MPARITRPAGNETRPTNRSPRARALKFLRWALFAVVGCEVFYLVAMNVFLSTPLFEMAINADPDVVDIHYARGWSFFPTRIYAKGLSIRATDSHIEWVLRFDDIDFDCSLMSLAKQKFYVTRARGSGISFRVRMKVASPAATRDSVAHLATIDTLGTVGLIPDEYPNVGEWDDKKYHLWTVQIDDAIAEHVREIWIENGRFQGDARVVGSFYLKPIRAAQVGPAHVDIRSGSFEIDGLPVAKPLEASLDLTLARFDPRTATNDDMLHGVTLSVDAKTEIPDLDNLGLDLPESGQLWGRLAIPKLALRIEKGVIRDGTHLEAHGESLRGTTSAHVVTGGVDLTANVAGDKLAAGASLEGLEGDFALTVPRVGLAIDSAALDLANPFIDLHGVVDVPRAELLHAERLADFLPKKAPAQIAGGELRASLHAEGWRAEERVRGAVGLHARDLDARTDKLSIRGNVDLDASVGSFRFDARKGTDGRIALAIPEGTAASRAKPGEPFVRLSGARVDAEAATLDLDHPLASLHAAVALPDAELFDPDSAHAALGLGDDVRLAGRKLKLSASAEATFEGEAARGAIDVHASRAGLEYAGRKLVLDLDAKGKAHAANWQKGVVALDEARIDGTYVVLSDAASPAAVTIQRLAIGASSPTFSTSDPLAHVQIVAAIDGGRMLSPSALDDLLPAGQTVLASKDGATFDADLSAQVSDHVARGAASINARGLGVAGSKIRVSGDLGVVANVARWDLRKKQLGGDVALDLAKVSGGFDPRGTTREFGVDRIAARFSAASLDLGHPSMEGVDYRLHVGRAELVDARGLNAFLPSPAILAVESGHALISADIGTSRESRAGGGQIDVLLADGGLRLHQTHLAGDFELEVKAHGFNPEHATVGLEGSHLAMRDVRVTGASTDTSAWSGDLVLGDSSLALSPAPKLEGDLTLQARDASPFLGILFGDSLPKLLVPLTKMPAFTAVTHVSIEPANMVVSDLFAAGGDIAVRGTYVLHQSDLAAAFVAQKGPLSAGISLDNAGAHLRLFGLDHWYGEHARQALAPR